MDESADDYARNVLRKRKDETRRKVVAKEFLDDMVTSAVSKLHEAQKKNGGRLPYGRMAEVLQGLVDNGAKATKHSLNYLLKHYVKPAGISAEAPVAISEEAPAHAPLSVINVNREQQSSISSLQGVEGVENAVTTKKAGRPKGTTRNGTKSVLSKNDECKVEIAKAYVEKMDETKAAGKERVSRGYLHKLIREKKTAHGIPNSYYISEKTIKNRIKRRRIDPPHPGVTSPLAAAEETLVQLCIMMGNVRQPLTPTEGLQVMNSLIKGQGLQLKLIEFKLLRGLGGDLDHLGQVGRSYWTGFMRRHGDRLVTKRGEKFASNRADWSKYSYIKQMYDVIYDEFVAAGVARVREKEVFMDRLGNIVEEDKKFGEAVNIEITHPDYILFGDETGCNTSQKKDGHEAGTKYVVARGQTPRTSCSTTDHRFTLLPITSASGEPVICVVIFQGKTSEIPSHWTTGIDTRVDPVRGSDGRIRMDGEFNFGPGKYFPGGPTCTYRGKIIPCATYITEGGGISGEILVSILQTLDDLDVFPRVPGGPVPVLIIDGHESRLDPMFLTYINGEGHVWKVCLGVPYATSYWQVGDSAEQNGTFKVCWYREKRILVRYKSDRGMPLCINPWDVMPLMNKCFSHSYGRIQTNKNATSDRGWCPANRKLLSHPDLLPDTPTNQQAEEPSSSSSGNTPPEEMNLGDGALTTCLQRVIQHHARNGGIEAHQQKLREGTGAISSLDEAKRITSGILVASGIHSLNNPELQRKVELKQQETLQKQIADLRKKRKELLSKIRKVKETRARKGRGELTRFENWDAKNCRDYLQYKRRKDIDTAMPKNVGPLRTRCLEVMGRGSPIASPHSSDDETSVMEDNEESQDYEDNVPVENILLVQTDFGEFSGNI
jgi:phage terminase small subunit